MLTLEKTTNTFHFTHTETKTAYTLKPLTAKRYNTIIDRNTKNGRLDVIGKMRDLSVECIEGWEGVGTKESPAECNLPNRATFGEKFAFSVMPAIVDKCLEAGSTGIEEIEEAKND